MTDEQKILLLKITVLESELDDFIERIEAVAKENLSGLKMFLIYRNCLISLKNILDLIKERGIGLLLDLQNDKVLNTQKKNLIKRLEPYNNPRNEISGHLVLEAFQNILSNNFILKAIETRNNESGYLVMKELIEGTFDKIYDLSKPQDITKVGEKLGQAFIESKNFFESAKSKLLK